jgi:thiamine transport system ATP-binding protein
MLSIEALQIQRDGRTLRYDLSVRTGEILAIQGRSGVGKTTLLDAIAGFVSPLSGDIHWQNQSMNQLTADQRPVSMLFQDHNLFEHLSVEKNLSLGFGDNLPLEKLREAARRLEVDDQLHKRPPELSGGQRQRIALIRTLLRPEPLILLDEPFAELDSHSRQQAARWTRETAKAGQKTLLLVTHQDEDVALVADRQLTL